MHVQTKRSRSALSLHAALPRRGVAASRSTGSLPPLRGGGKVTKAPPLPTPDNILPASWRPAEGGEDADEAEWRARQRKKTCDANYKAWLRSVRKRDGSLGHLKSQSTSCLAREEETKAAAAAASAAAEQALRAKSVVELPVKKKLGWGAAITQVRMIARLQIGGRRSHDEWLEDKMNADEDAKDRLGQFKAQERRRKLKLQGESNSRYELAVTKRLNHGIEEHERVKHALMCASSLDSFKGSRPNSAQGCIPLLPTVALPSEEEKWDLALDVCALRDRLDSVAPGKDKLAKQPNRVKRYPRHLPPKPTREAIIKTSGLKANQIK